MSLPHTSEVNTFRSWSAVSVLPQVTERRGERRTLLCKLSVKVFGHELSFVNCGAMGSHVKWQSLNLAELAVKLLKGQEVQVNRRLSLAMEELAFPTMSGLPAQLTLNAVAAISVCVRGATNFQQLSDFSVNGYVKPSTNGHSGCPGAGRAEVGDRHLRAASLDGRSQPRKGRELKVHLNTPQKAVELLSFRWHSHQRAEGVTSWAHVHECMRVSLSCISSLGVTRGASVRTTAPLRPTRTDKEVSRTWGWQLCTEVTWPALSAVSARVHGCDTEEAGSRPPAVSAGSCLQPLPPEGQLAPSRSRSPRLHGHAEAGSAKGCRGGHQLQLVPEEVLVQASPSRKKIELDGKIEALRSAHMGHLELILDDRDVYYIKRQGLELSSSSHLGL
ncbi:uncharacterized protein LOC111819995 [Trichechus manatus latirostris]|uniref:Uncharacterized protein LOC111819995 n=1 Tax=Trichechus manatus latirostris TaxID=127582 RepID=A0A2Y9QXF6_TRIMA|nr:uncharacterized protein LOC111819995 [Trichechus manatus latirostris]